MLDNGFIELVTLVSTGVSGNGDPLPAIETVSAKIACNVKYLKTVYQVVEGGRTKYASARITFDTAKIPDALVITDATRANVYNNADELTTKREIVMLQRGTLLKQIILLLE